MKRRILAIWLCICMAAIAVLSSVADTVVNVAGDANEDSRVSVSDASLVLRYCVGLDNSITARGRMCADVNYDFSVEADDAVLILRAVAGLVQLKDPAALDTSLYQKLIKQSLLGDAAMTEWAARYIQSLPKGNRRNILYAAAAYIGTAYNKMDCSSFIKESYLDAGIDKSVYPGKSSDETLKWYRTNYPNKLISVNYNDGNIDVSKWKPGAVLIYLNPSTGRANHLALYVGEIDGMAIIMDSRSSGANGVRIGYLWSTDSWVLSYYVDPLS